MWGFVLKVGGELLIVRLYVDDLVVVATHRATLDKFKSDISVRYQMKDLGELTWILGMEVLRDRQLGTLELRQTAYINQLIERHGLGDCKPVRTPAEGPLEADAEAQPDRAYMLLVGGLLYAATMTRPDIAFAVQRLSRHLKGASEAHWIAGKRVLRYLQGTRELGIKYGARPQADPLVGYSDADHAGDLEGRRSISAYVFMMAGGAVSWGCKLKKSVATSTCEAEYMALCLTGKEAVHLRGLMASMGAPTLAKPTVVYEDNQGAIEVAKNTKGTRKMEHVDVAYHFTGGLVTDEVIKLVHIGTEYQLADLLTKPLSAPRVLTLRRQVRGYG